MGAARPDQGGLPRSACPTCGYAMASATMVPADEDGAPAMWPEPGDLSLCIQCGAMLTFNDDLTLRSLPDADFRALDGETQYALRVRQSAIYKLHGGRQ